MSSHRARKSSPTYDGSSSFSKQNFQVNKIAYSCEICSGPHDTQYCMKNPEQAFIKYASTRTDEAGDAKTSRFEADFKQYQSEVTNKLDAFLKAFNDQMKRVLPSDTIKNPKLNLNCFKSATCDKKDQLQINTLRVNESETPTLKEPEKTLEDEFADLHLNLPVLELLAHVPMYDALLDKYIISLELAKNGSEYIQSVAPEKMKDPGLFILPCILGDSKPFDTLADLGSCVNLISLKLFKELKVHVGKLKLFEDFYVVDMEREPTCPLLVGRGFLATANAVIDSKKAKIAVGEGLTRSIFGVKELDFGEDNESEDLVENPINWNRPPKEGDDAWHIRIELIDPDGEKFDRAFQSIPTNKKLSLKENPSDILNLDHFHDSYE
ncbi:hypothetical protein Tco_1208714 [Tanacetum coccineum]